MAIDNIPFQGKGRKMIDWKVAGKIVKIDDWDSALVAASALDKLEPGEDRGLIQGQAALRIVAEYGLKLYETGHPGEGIQLKLAIVIDRNAVYVTPSKDGEDGVFIGKYRTRQYGGWFKKITIEDIWGFSNIEAMIDGRTFLAEIISNG